MKQNFIKALIITALISAMVYFVTRSILFTYSDYTRIEKLIALMLICAEFFILIHGSGYMINILKVYRKKLSQDDGIVFEETLKGEEPSVAILVAARHEPRKVLEETFITLSNLNYHNKSVYFLDDSSEEKYKKEAETLANELGLILFRREKRHGAKAGIINDCLKGLDHKYIAVFDADQTPLPEFLNKLIPILERNEKLAFIQTPQFYTNIKNSVVARAAAFQQAVFYEYICEGKGTDDAMFCCGTNIVFRKKALLEVGGLDESTVTEDFATSIKLHTSGWESMYYSHVYAFGMAPEDLTGYFQQQFRWANGTITVFKRIIWTFLRRPFSLSPSQWWEYFLSGSFYFIGMSFFFLMLCPILYLLFNIPSFFARPEIYFLTFLPYILLTTSVFYSILSIRHYQKKDLFLGQLLGVLTFSVYMRAAFSAILGVKTTFGITTKTKGEAIPYIRLWPQISVILFSFTAVVWGINRFICEREPAIIINSFWAFCNCAMLSSIFYFNQADTSQISCRKLLKGVRLKYRIIETASRLEDLSAQTWQDSIKVFLPQNIEANTLVMCKLILKNDETVIFDGNIISSSDKKKRKGFETIIGVVKITSYDRNRFMEITQL
jgi:cellulose synthase (UDP-forming)